MEPIHNEKINCEKDKKRVSKTWEAALKSKGTGWVTYPKFVNLTKECKGE
ncbi:MAG: hypothetical protein MJZ30_09105 [Paludibacteraceae bacterium]|nr:hypothetical protein [Paludibacteraceae bacterium]